MIIRDKEKRLEEINKKLLSEDLQPIHKLGDATKGELEILEIKNIYKNTSGLSACVNFVMLTKEFKKIEYLAYLNTGSGGHMYVFKLDKYILVTKQWRPIIGKWLYELPNGFIKNIIKDEEYKKQKYSGMPMYLLERKMGQEFIKKIDIVEKIALGCAYENPGITGNITDIFLIEIKPKSGITINEIISNKFNGDDLKQDIKSYFWLEEEVEKEIGNKICDLRSITCWSLYEKYIKKQK